MPPSEPRSSRASFEALDAHLDRPARLQMIVALILGLVLVAIPLYLWRRPRAESISAAATLADATALPAVTGAQPGPLGLVIGDPKILSCHDPGPKKTPPERCDHVVELEKAFSKAIEESGACVPRDAGGGTVTYLADVSFRKRTIAVSTLKDGRTLKGTKVVAACERAVKAKLSALAKPALATMKRDHVRYRVAITATYPSAKP